MNCPNCNSELRAGAKFCTKCGQKIEMGSQCPQCAATLKPGAKFCTKCGHRLDQPTSPIVRNETTVAKPAGNQLPSDMSESKGRIYWNVQPGQVARVITETEFESYNQIRGVIVPEGTTAYIRANGKTIATIGGGSYEFVNAEQSMLRKGWQFVLGLFKGQKEGQSVPSEQEVLYKHQQQVILENAKQGAAFSVVILLNKAFPLLIGAKHGNTDGYKQFIPMRIRTRYLDLDLGVNAYFKIADPERFILHYLTDCQMLNSALIADEITDTIRVALQDVLYDVELNSTRIPHELHQILKDRINAVAAESFFGLSIVRIVEVSADSEDLARFTKLSQELYLSEQELDYLRRTNDFKNRLADVVNEQEIHQATTELELKRKLNEINRNSRNEELLNEDELRKFEHLLMNERIVREAKTEHERDIALIEIAKTGLVREEELRVMQHQMKTNTYQRGMALAMMQLRDGIEFERVRMEGELEKAEMIVKKELDLQEMRDDYTDRRFYKELDKQKAVEDAKIDLEQRRRDMDYNDAKRIHDMKREDDDAQFRQFMAMAEMAERGKDKERLHKESMEKDRQKHEEEMQRMKWESAQNLSEEKVWALQGGEAAVSYTQNKYNAERERELNERMNAERQKEEEKWENRRREQEARLDAERASRDADRRANDEHLFNMVNNMMAMMGGVQSQRAEDRDRRYQESLEEKDRQLRERDERIRRQEGRMDTAYDRALDYTTREKLPPQQPQPQYTPQPAASQPYAKREVEGLVCPSCGKMLEAGAMFCDDCGEKL